MLRILHVADNSYPNIGGVERVVHEIAKRQLAMGNVVAVVSQWRDFRVLRVGSFCFEGVKYVLLPRLLFPYLAYVYAKKFGPDVVHLNSYLSSSFFSRDGVRERVVRHVHDVYTSLFQKYFGLNIEAIASRLEKSWTERFEYYVVPSHSTKRRLVGLIGGGKKVWVVPNGVDTSVFRPRRGFWLKRRLGLEDSAKIVGFVGRIAFGKGAFEAYLAARPLLAKHRGVYLVYVGPSDTLKTSGQRGALDKIVRQAALDGFSSRVFYLPPLSDDELACAYSDLEVLMLPSFSEGFGLSVLEAAACGTPSIVYDSGSLPELVEHGKTGFVVKQGDTGGLSEALEAILNQPGVRDEFSSRCIVRAKRYDWQSVVTQIHDIYREILNHSYPS